MESSLAVNTSESVIVNIEWTGSAGFMTTDTAQPVMGNTTTYISTVVVSSFRREKSGEYSCTATVSLQMSNIRSMAVSRMERITVGKY